MSLLDWLGPRPEGKPDSPESLPRKQERGLHREQLYAIVRECMANAGVVSAAYRFKVLSLDSAGHRFLVMVDIASDCPQQPEDLSRIETAIASLARVRHGIGVRAVYWRIGHSLHEGKHEHHEHPQAHRPTPPARPPEQHRHAAPQPVPQRHAASQPPRPHSYTLLTGYEDTEQGGAYPPALSETQPGDLR